MDPIRRESAAMGTATAIAIVRDLVDVDCPLGVGDCWLFWELPSTPVFVSLGMGDVAELVVGDVAGG